jgi:D-alanyl-D-alanine carboxypeptidase (penicillin-binding protein 5/6)
MQFVGGLQPKRKNRVRFALLLLVIAGSLTQTTLSAHASQESVSLQESSSIIQEQLNGISEYRTVTADASTPPVFAKSYVLIDGKTGELLIGSNERAVLPVASTTKMTTALVARELFKLDEVATVSSTVYRVPDSRIRLVPGEKITVHDLLKGLLIQSGNDAGYVLAEHYSKEEGNELLFVEKMNEYVRRHGIKDTVYGDPAGLDDEKGRSTALSLAQTARLLLQDPVLASIVKTPEESVYSVDGRYVHELKNSNRLVIGDSPYYLPNVYGIKTGFTYDAGHCLVSAYTTPDGIELIGVVLNTHEYSVTASASEMRKLFVWAANNIENVEY